MCFIGFKVKSLDKAANRWRIDALIVNGLGGFQWRDASNDAHVAGTQFGQIMNCAVENNERFIIDCRGEPAVVIMSVQDFITPFPAVRNVSPPQG
jgi:hypothetical protein